MGKIKLLDCTLRDGAYIVDSKFGDAAIKGIIKKLQDAGASYGLAQSQQKNQPDTEEQDEPDESPDEETDDRFLRKKRRKKYRNGVM